MVRHPAHLCDTTDETLQDQVRIRRRVPYWPDGLQASSPEVMMEASEAVRASKADIECS